MPSAGSPSSFSTPHTQCVGRLIEKDQDGSIRMSRALYAHEEVIIGRDPIRCQYVVEDPMVSNRHLRIYTIIFDNNTAPLVYAEDLSRNGTYWNGSLIGRGNGGYLLSDSDALKISPSVEFGYATLMTAESPPFDNVQKEEMALFDGQYIITNRRLGDGSFGQVHMAIEKVKRSQLACKIINIRKIRASTRRMGRLEQPASADDVNDRSQLRNLRSWGTRHAKVHALEERLKDFRREADILERLSHPNIISLEKVYITESNVYILQDLVTGGDLFSFLERKNGKLLDDEAAIIVLHVLKALEYLHDKNIVHRDLKPENILLTSLAQGSRVVLTDFGAARAIEPLVRMSSCVGTLEYAAPEMPRFPASPTALISGYTKSVDMWALGCVTVVLLTGCSPFVDSSTKEHSLQPTNSSELEQLETGPGWFDVGELAKDFVRNLLVLDETKRMDVKAALSHAWFKNGAYAEEFEDNYQKAVKFWKRRIPKQSLIEVLDHVRPQETSRHPRTSPKKQRQKVLVPIDPPYIPYPRRLSHTLFPKRDPRLPPVSEEVRAAIESDWPSESESSKSTDHNKPSIPPRKSTKSASFVARKIGSGSPTGQGHSLPKIKCVKDDPKQGTARKSPFKLTVARKPAASASRSRPVRPIISLKGSKETTSMYFKRDNASRVLQESRSNSNLRRSFSPGAWADETEPSTTSLAFTGRPEDNLPSPRNNSRVLPSACEATNAETDEDVAMALSLGENLRITTGSPILGSADPGHVSTPTANSISRLKTVKPKPRSFSNTPNTKKRRRSSIFDFEGDEPSGTGPSLQIVQASGDHQPTKRRSTGQYEQVRKGLVIEETDDEESGDDDIII